jgi:Cellulose binding domain
MVLGSQAHSIRPFITGVAVRTVLSVLLAALAALPASHAVAATPAPPGSSAPTASGSPLPGEPRCTAQVVPVLRWTGGFQATVTITNLGDAPMYSWYVTWTWPDWPGGARMTQAWNGIAMVSGPVAMIHAPSWHSPLAPGQTATAGLLATGDPPTTDLQVRCG